MKILLHVFMQSIFLLTINAQEMTIPVGENGKDTVTIIRNFDAFGNYDVGYNENQLTGGASFHREKGYTNGTRTGSYGYTTRNGLIRIVTYVADENGYRAEIITNEPGVGAESSSNVNLTKEAEPDAEALAAGPTGVPQPSDVAQDEPTYLVQNPGSSYSNLPVMNPALVQNGYMLPLQVSQGSENFARTEPGFSVKSGGVKGYLNIGGGVQVEPRSVIAPDTVNSANLGATMQSLSAQNGGSFSYSNSLDIPISRNDVSSEGVSQSSVVYAQESNVVRNYVLGALSS